MPNVVSPSIAPPALALPEPPETMSAVASRPAAWSWLQAAYAGWKRDAPSSTASTSDSTDRKRRREEEEPSQALFRSRTSNSDVEQTTHYTSQGLSAPSLHNTNLAPLAQDNMHIHASSLLHTSNQIPHPNQTQNVNQSQAQNQTQSQNNLQFIRHDEDEDDEDAHSSSARDQNGSEKRRKLERWSGSVPLFSGFTDSVDREPGWTYRSWVYCPHLSKRREQRLDDETQQTSIERLLKDKPDHNAWNFTRKIYDTPEGNVWRDKNSFCELLGTPLNQNYNRRVVGRLVMFSDPRHPYVTSSRPQLFDERWRPTSGPTTYHKKLERQMRINPVYFSVWTAHQQQQQQ